MSSYDAIEVLGELFAFGAALVIGVFAILLVVWLLNTIFIAKFCKAVGKSMYGLVFIPLGGISSYTLISAIDSVTSYAGTGKAALIFMILTYGSLLGPIPIVGAVLSIVGVISGIILWVLLVTRIWSFSKDYGRSAFGMCLIWVLVPFVGKAIVMTKFRKSFEEQSKLEEE